MSGGGSEQARLIEQIAILKDQLAQAQKLTALGELISTTTHEFNNVLMTIINYAKLGQRHPDAETAARSFDKILTAANRAARITNGILGFARNRRPGLEPTDMVKLIDDTILLLEREMVKYRVKVERRILECPPAMANTNQIQQVLLNILINARQAMPQGGTILVQLSHDQATDMVDLMVRDTGVGMPPETLRRIFEPFYTTKSGPDSSGKGGTGLGLSSCRDIIEAHHGKIRVESAVGKGTAFTIKLPAFHAAPIAAPLPAMPLGESPDSGWLGHSAAVPQ
ncbi:MAG: ATP-binding protein [Planctomycetales bacterium]|nr:ATP-binding protein [Planctomycetales bacterium]MBN8627646.1 ATP-binding protein [Planctomycetota bacterium]